MQSPTRVGKDRNTFQIYKSVFTETTQEEIPSKSLVGFTKASQKHLQDKLQCAVTKPSNADTVCTLCETPLKYYHKSGPLVPFNNPLIIINNNNTCIYIALI